MGLFAFNRIRQQQQAERALEPVQSVIEPPAVVEPPLSELEPPPVPEPEPEPVKPARKRRATKKKEV
ncbi:hypothetical protein JL100_017950 [Skermanella mucosa]|uniref:hypothetical protein n=1 Tax=Skermanella mucosa TaxID=1789672 RepID=UPI001E41CFB4|nr:hypothetical protein [Skermanella mucosa]UEM18969.1 hypothetical protein JL100_017950 [Skermanella mucosa]